jgi:ribonuclease BN (tRNA processing enzyme)
MKLTFIGRGGAFAPISIGNSNMILESDSGKKMLIDFGITAPFIFRDEMGGNFQDVDAVYVTHSHADHVGGLEFLAFHRFFLPKKDGCVMIRPKLFAVRDLMKELWDHTLKGGLESLQGKIMNMTDYFDCYPISTNKVFSWEGHYFTPIQTVHVRSGYIIKHSYGLGVSRERNGTYDAYITSDTQFDRGLTEYYNRAKIIFQDCETGNHRSIVHAHYDDLKTLHPDIKEKMWLYHYGNIDPNWESDGFAGFVEKGQEFEF